MITKEVNNPVGYRLELNPTKEQIEIFEKYFGVSRYIYNVILNYYIESSQNGRLRQLSYYELTAYLSEYKHIESNAWLKEYDTRTLRIALRDCHTAIAKYLDKTLPNKIPRFKKKKVYSNHKSFGTRADNLYIRDDCVKLSTIGIIKLSGNAPEELQGCGNKATANSMCKYINYMNPRVIYDGIKYYLSFTINEDISNGITLNSNKKYRDSELWQHKPSTDIIGIDIGCKGNNWLVASNGSRLSMPDTSKEDKKIKKLQKKFSNQLKVNNKRWEKTNPSSSNRPRTKNELKTLKKWRKVEKHIHDKKINDLYNYISHEILSNKPQTVVIEDIYTTELLLTDKNISSYHKNRHNHMIYNAMPYRIKTTITNTVSRNNIPVIIADKEYPSSQLCSRCGNRMDIGKKRVYRCPICGLVIDRDDNASLNLRNYGYRILDENKELIA